MFTMRAGPAAVAVLWREQDIGEHEVADAVGGGCGLDALRREGERARQRVRHYVSANTAHSGLPASLMRIFGRSSLVNRWSATRLTSAMSVRSHRTKSVRVSRSSLLRPPFSAHCLCVSVLARMYTAARR